MRTLSKILAFFRRDLFIARSYRGVFVIEFFEALFGVATFYYLSRFVESPELDRVLPQGSNYFAFALVGFAFFDYLSISLGAFDTSLLEARENRTLEALVVTQTSLPVILLGSAVYPFALLSLRTLVYLGWGAILFGLSLNAVNWPGVVLVLLTSILAFSGLGIFSASYVLLFKRGNPAKWMFLGISGLTGGMMYPVSVLPHWLQWVSKMIPITYSLEGMRAALLQGAQIRVLLPSLGALLLFSAILLPLSIAGFAWALRRTKITGTLTHL